MDQCNEELFENDAIEANAQSSLFFGVYEELQNS